jgi:hypothetical protein
MKNVWDFFDAKYVLSTPQSKRKESLIKNFTAVGLTDFEIIDFNPSKRYTQSGKNDASDQKNQSILSIMSHDSCDDTCKSIAKNMFQLAKKGYDEGHERIIIFEDDARFKLPFSYKKMSKAIKWLNSHDWDIFYLGYCQWPMLVSWIVTSSVVKLTSPLCLHGYCLSRTGMEKVMKIHQYYDIRPLHLDKIYGEFKWKKYGIFPAICFQSEAPALYNKAVKQLPFRVHFDSLSKFSEYSSIASPFIIMMVILIIMIMFFRNVIKK